MTIERADARQVLASGAQDYEVLILSWPPYADPIAADLLTLWGAGREVIYIGEDGGCTADDRFYELFEQTSRASYAWTRRVMR